MESFLSLYNLFKKDKKKERFDIILEPLQAMTQLALLSFCPRGSKLTITNNILSIQLPTWGQSLLRSYNQDKRDDLFFLFNAITRFNQFYTNQIDLHLHENTKKLIALITKLSKIGIDNILQTYANSDQPSLLHTLHMYRSILDKPELFNENKSNDDNSTKNIDDVFIQITSLYSLSEHNIIYNTFLLLEKRPDQYETYMMGLNHLMDPINTNIKKWINDNIVY
jgi:hypothetical protein